MIHYSREAAVDEVEDGGEEDGGDEDFSQGLYSFLRRVHDCRLSRQQQTTPLSADDVCIENRLVAAATFEKSFM